MDFPPHTNDESNENEETPPQRWYDKDPALSQAVEQLRQSSTKYQAQIALNIIKVIIEHRIEGQSEVPIETLSEYLKCQESSSESGVDSSQKRRWYDVDEALCSAMQLLHDCPDDLQKRIVPSITRMIEATLSEQL